MPGRDRSGFGPNTILFGIGNNVRGDDGLGWAFLDRVDRETDFPGRLEYRYQLQVEDAELISRAERVVFVDAYRSELPGGFQWAPCQPTADADFTSHVLSPGALLHICRDLYAKSPSANLLVIQGRSWDLHLGMSPVAERNLDRAVRFFTSRFQHLAGAGLK